MSLACVSIRNWRYFSVGAQPRKGVQHWRWPSWWTSEGHRKYISRSHGVRGNRYFLEGIRPVGKRSGSWSRSSSDKEHVGVCPREFPVYKSVGWDISWSSSKNGLLWWWKNQRRRFGRRGRRRWCARRSSSCLNFHCSECPHLDYISLPFHVPMFCYEMLTSSLK